jgi:hypothetical protein
MPADPTLRPRLPERALIVGAILYRKRMDVGWTRRYAAPRLGLSESELLAFEKGHPILEGQFRRIMRIYNRTLYKVTRWLR